MYEKDKFFDALKTFGRDFDNITDKVATKNYEQVISFSNVLNLKVRHFYYRLLKKVNGIIHPQTIDKKDQKETLIILNYYWELKKQLGQKEDEKKFFAIKLREIVAKTYVTHNIVVLL